MSPEVSLKTTARPGMKMHPAVAKAVAELNKALGPGTVVLASDVVAFTRVTSGSLMLDLALGGGWPMNQWIELVGDPSHGKTAVALKTVAVNQRRDPDWVTVWVASEPWSGQYAEMCGVDVSRVILVETAIMEEAYDSALKFLDTKAVDMVVIDSLPNLVPTLEDDKDMGEMTVGKGALLTNKFFRKALFATKRATDGTERPVMGIMINQFRMKIGVMHGDPRTTPGGQGKDYAYGVRCEVRRTEWIEAGTGADKTRIGQTIRIRTIKNKTAPPQRVAEFDFYFAEGGDCDPGDYDRAKEVFTIGVIFDLIDRKGGWYYLDGRKWQGKDHLLLSLREEVDLYEKLAREVSRIALTQGMVSLDEE